MTLLAGRVRVSQDQEMRMSTAERYGIWNGALKAPMHVLIGKQSGDIPMLQTNRDEQTPFVNKTLTVIRKGRHNSLRRDMIFEGGWR